MPRIAVTVDLIATGIDVKPIECLIFLRNVASLGYYEQMVGRGLRVIDHDALKLISGEHAPPKSRFVIVDAVGVCDRDKTSTRPLDRQPCVSGRKIAGFARGFVVYF